MGGCRIVQCTREQPTLLHAVPSVARPDPTYPPGSPSVCSLISECITGGQSGRPLNHVALVSFSLSLANARVSFLLDLFNSILDVFLPPSATAAETCLCALPCEVFLLHNRLVRYYTLLDKRTIMTPNDFPSALQKKVPQPLAKLKAKEADRTARNHCAHGGILVKT